MGEPGERPSSRPGVLARAHPQPSRLRRGISCGSETCPVIYDIAERCLDVAHHLPAQADWAEIEKLGGSRIITCAEGCTIVDGDGHRILDGMAGSWCVNVGYGREELVEAAAAQMRELPFYNTFSRPRRRRP